MTAFIVLNDGHGRTLGHSQALELKKVIDGQLQGTKAQKAFAKRVRAIYFAKDKLPEAEQQLAWYQK